MGASSGDPASRDGTHTGGRTAALGSGIISNCTQAAVRVRVSFRLRVRVKVKVNVEVTFNAKDKIKCQHVLRWGLFARPRGML